MIETVRRFAAWQITVLTWDFRDLELNKSRYIHMYRYFFTLYSIYLVLPPFFWFTIPFFLPPSSPFAFFFHWPMLAAGFPASICHPPPPLPPLFFSASFISKRLCLSHKLMWQQNFNSKLFYIHFRVLWWALHSRKVSKFHLRPWIRL